MNEYTGEHKEHEMDAICTASGVEDHTGVYSDKPNASSASPYNQESLEEEMLLREVAITQEDISSTTSEANDREIPAKKPKKNHGPMAVFMAATILLSGLSGYTGATIANQQAPKIYSGTAASNINMGNPSTPSEGLSVSGVVSTVANSVVEITTERVTRDGFLDQFVSQGAGSGVIISSDGYILTNNHVIDSANKISVRLHDGKTYPATLKGTDRRLDVAVIKINANNLAPVTYGDSDRLTVGETAIAIGNPLGELGGTVTAGIISALNRDILIKGENMNLLQTSAAVNPGNSGGGLFNASGQLIGIVSAKSFGNNVEGIGFAIPVNAAKTAADAIIKDGYVKGRVLIGISLADIPDEETARRYGLKQTGVYVANIARENGFRTGDRIISVEGKEITSSAQVKAAVSAHKAGDRVSFQIDRDGNIFDLTVTLTEDKE